MRKPKNHKITNSVTKINIFLHCMEGFQKIFMVYLDIIHETLSQKFHPHSILSQQTKVESLPYDVLKLGGFQLIYLLFSRLCLYRQDKIHLIRTLKSRLGISKLGPFEFLSRSKRSLLKIVLPICFF